MNTYFKSSGRIYKVTVNTNDPDTARLRSRTAAEREKLTIESPVLAVVSGGKTTAIPVKVAA